MSILEQYRNSKQLWIITLLIFLLLISLGVLAYLSTSRAVAPPSPDSLSEGGSSALKEEERERPSSNDESEKPLSSSIPQVGSSEPPASSKPDLSAAPIPVPAAQDMVITTDGIYDGPKTYRNVTVKAANTTLRNLVIEGDLILSAEVGDGEILLDQVTVDGEVLVEGGGKVTVNNTSLAKVITRRSAGTTRYIITGDSTIPTLIAKSHLTIDQAGVSEEYDGIRDLSVEEGIPIWQSVTLKSGTLQNVITMATGNVIVEKNASIHTLTAKAKTHIGGDGIVSTLIVSHREVSYQNRPQTVEKSEGYSDAVQRSWAIGEMEPSQGGGSSEISNYQLSNPTGLAITADEDGKLIFSFAHTGSHVRGYQVTFYVNDENREQMVLDVTDTKRWEISAGVFNPDDVIRFTVQALSSRQAQYHSGISSKSQTIIQLPVPANMAIAAEMIEEQRHLIFSFDPVLNGRTYRLTPYKNNIAQPAVDINAENNEDRLSYRFIFEEEGSYRFSVKAIGDGCLVMDSSESPFAPEYVVQQLAIPLATLELSDQAAVLTLTPIENATGYTVWLEGKSSPLSPADPANPLVFTFTPDTVGEYSFLAQTNGDELDNISSAVGEIVGASFKVLQRPMPANLSAEPSGNNEDNLRISFAPLEDASHYLVEASYGNESSEDLDILSLKPGAAAHEYTTTLQALEGNVLKASVTALGYVDSDNDIIYFSSETAVLQKSTLRLATPKALSVSDNQDGNAKFSFNKVEEAVGYRLNYTSLPEQTAMIDSGFVLDTQVSFILEGQSAYMLKQFSVVAIGDGVFWLDSAAANRTVAVLATPTSFSLKTDEAEQPAQTAFSFAPVENAVSYGVTCKLKDQPAINMIPTFSDSVAISYDIANGTKADIEYLTVLAMAPTTEDVCYLPSVIHTVSVLPAPEAADLMIEQKQDDFLLTFSFIANNLQGEYTLTYYWGEGENENSSVLLSLLEGNNTLTYDVTRPANDITRFTVCANEYSLLNHTYLQSEMLEYSA